jgi:hypothetical protein
MIWSIAHGAEAFRAAVWTSATRLTITTRNRRLVQDYGDGLRQFIGHVLAAVQIAIAVVLRHCCTGRRFQPSCSSCLAPFGTTAAAAMRTDTPPLCAVQTAIQGSFLPGDVKTVTRSQRPAPVRRRGSGRRNGRNEICPRKRGNLTSLLRDPWSPTSAHLSQVFRRRIVGGARPISAGRFLTSHFEWHDRSHVSTGRRRSAFVTAGSCASLRLIRPGFIFAQVSHAARWSEAEPHR